MKHNFSGTKLHVLGPDFYIHVSVSGLFIPTTDPQQTCSWEYISRPQIYECVNWETEHYNPVLNIARLRSFISWNTYIGTRHLYWILTGPLFAVQAEEGRSTLPPAPMLYSRIVKDDIRLFFFFP